MPARKPEGRGGGLSGTGHGRRRLSGVSFLNFREVKLVLEEMEYLALYLRISELGGNEHRILRRWNI
jgi:hypothetical protein